MIERACDHCGVFYSAEKTTSKYCSDSCKTLASRQRKKDEQVAELRKQYQAELDELNKKSAEEERIKKEKFDAEQAEIERNKEQERIENLERIHQENQTKRNREAEKRLKEREKRMKESQERFQLKVIGIAAVVGIGYQIFKPKTLPPKNIDESLNQNPK